MPRLLRRHTKTVIQRSSSGPKAHAPGPELNAIALREALCCFRMRQGRVELFERPIYFAAGDHQGWTNTDGVVVGVLAQDAATAQRVAVAPSAASVRVKLEGDY